MLERASALARRYGWSNVFLSCGDAASFEPPNPIQAVLFSFSYSTTRERLGVLQSAWRRLEPGGRIVITDASLRLGWPRRVFYRLGVWVSDRTLLGKPDTDPASDLARVAGSVREERISFGPFGFDHVICSATRQETGACPGRTGDR